MLKYLRDLFKDLRLFHRKIERVEQHLTTYTISVMVDGKAVIANCLLSDLKTALFWLEYFQKEYSNPVILTVQTRKEETFSYTGERGTKDRGDVY